MLSSDHKCWIIEELRKKFWGSLIRNVLNSSVGEKSKFFQIQKRHCVIRQNSEVNAWVCLRSSSYLTMRNSFSRTFRSGMRFFRSFIQADGAKHRAPLISLTGRHIYDTWESMHVWHWVALFEFNNINFESNCALRYLRRKNDDSVEEEKRHAF